MSQVPDPRPGDDIAEIMVVCTANIVRSPFGMAMLQASARDRLGEDPPVWVRSTGVNANDDYPAVEQMREEAATRGINLAPHRSAFSTPDDVERSDLILTMTERHRRKIARLHPLGARYTFTVKEFVRLLEALKPITEEIPPRERIRLMARLASGAKPYVERPDGPEDVEDPIGGPREGYKVAAAEIEGLMGRIAPILFGGAPQEPVPTDTSLFG